MRNEYEPETVLKVVKTTVYKEPFGMEVQYDLRVGTRIFLQEDECAYIPDAFVAGTLANQLREFVNLAPLDKIIHERMHRPDTLNMRYYPENPIDVEGE